MGGREKVRLDTQTATAKNAPSHEDGSAKHVSKYDAISTIVRDISCSLHHSLSQIYADDKALYVASNDYSAVTDRLQEDLTCMHQALTDEGLIFNPQKTKFVMFRQPAKLIPGHLKLTCAGVDIPLSTNAKYLSVKIDEYLTFERHVNNACNTVHKKLGAFRHAEQA